MKEEDKTIRIFSGTELEVNMLKEQLDLNGIPSRIENDLQSGQLAGFYGGSPSSIDLFILESDLTRAEPILQNFGQRLQS